MNIPEENNAIVCRGVYKTYGSAKSAFPVLQDVNITVPKGTIYSLLGPSGSGKTTLLKCILGRLSINDGSVLVYDQSPHLQNDANKPNVGYMPQDISLAEELTVDETLRLFGKIAKMSYKKIEEKRKFLVEFLEMPYHKREIRTLSGGQKRRVSFAVALICEPEILILDEPTVGVDPPLRKSIWEYMYTLADTKNATIIVTTHYIEEANMAHNVGMMLNGYMVAEDKPGVLIEKHGCQTLEKTFLKLCRLCNIEQPEDKEIMKVNDDKLKEIDVTLTMTIEGDKTVAKSPAKSLNRNYQEMIQSISSYKNKFQRPDAHRIWALFVKDFRLFLRNPGLVFGNFFVPSMLMFLCYLCIGQPLSGLPVGIVNHDGMNFSRLYLQSINSDFITQVHYNKYDDAFKDAKNGKTWGVLYLNPNFTNSIRERYETNPFVNDVSLENSLIGISMDLSNKNVEILIRLELQKSYERFLQGVFKEMGLNINLADFIIKFESRQVYGSRDSNYVEYIFPSQMLQLTFYIAMAVTAVTLVVAKESGSLDRLYIAGVDFIEVAFGQILAQLAVLMIHSSLLCITVFGILGFACSGSYILAYLLLVFQGICGITLGVLITSVCEQQTMAIIVCISCFLIGCVMNTSMWPIQGLHQAFRVFVLLLPNAYASEALRSVISRGWNLTHRAVISGFSVSIVWSAIFIISSMIIFKLRP